jgi:hypothetical protein
MEKHMPDLQTQLAKALEEGKRKFLNATLDAWEHHEQEIRQPQPQPKEKTMSAFIPTKISLSADIFACIKHAPRAPVSVKEIMIKAGYNKTSVFSLITQMKRAKLIELREGVLYTLVDAYSPINRTYKKPNKTKAQAGIAALPSAATAPIIKTTWDASTIIDHLSLRQARALYDELTKVFGGK